MAHFAKVENGIVTEILVVHDNEEHRGQEFLANDLGLGGTWIKTSYNTRGNVHLNNGTPLHKNYAGIGYHWDGIGFYPPKPFSSWIKNEDTYLWEAPVPMPTDNKIYYWDEEKLSWVEEVTSIN